LKCAQYKQQDSNLMITALFLHLDMAASRWPASQSKSSSPLPENFEPQVSQCNRYPLDTILLCFSMGIKVNFQCYLVARFWSQRSDLCHLITEILDNNQDYLHFQKAKCFVGMYCLYSIFILFLSANLSELLTTIYESPAYLSLKSWKEKLAQNIFKNYETLLEFSLYCYNLMC